MNKKDTDFLTSFERSVANEVAEAIRHRESHESIGLIIYSICKSHDVDHHKIASHLGMRGGKKKKL